MHYLGTLTEDEAELYLDRVFTGGSVGQVINHCLRISSGVDDSCKLLNDFHGAVDKPNEVRLKPIERFGLPLGPGEIDRQVQGQNLDLFVMNGLLPRRVEIQW